MKPFHLAVLICTFAAFGLIYPQNLNIVFADQQGNSEKENISFNWAFGALVGKESERKLVSITRDTTLKTGDQFKMVVELNRKCFVYLIYHSAQCEMQLLFPNNIKQFSNNYRTSVKYYIPHGDLWFALDENVGQETFYLLASVKRLTKLETLLNNHESADLKEKTALTTKILTEIRKIKRQHRTLTAAAERPVSIAGTVRGTTKNQKIPLNDVISLAVEITATDFYSRTFIIEHK
ncbi:MAG: DUF4384 domain-containing protein [Desulfobacteraceae bacterium]|nr:DUF4384 domain-containing protein [Desulfobacteraceae bacterium]